MAYSSVFAELVRDCKLDGSNFTVWKRKIMFLLTAENIDYVAMTDQPNEPAKEADDEEKENYREELKEWTKDHKRARIFILGSMTDSLADEYESEDVACVVMKRLEEDFGEVSLIRVLSLVNKFLTSKLTESGSVNEHLNKMCVLSEELKIAGYPFSEEVQVMVALNSLPHSWEQFKISFCRSERSLNMRTLRHHLIMEQDRKSSQGRENYSQPNELHLGEERRSWNKKNSGRGLRDKLNKKKTWSKHPKSKINKENYKCHHCGELGHFRADCPSRKKRMRTKGNNRRTKRKTLLLMVVLTTSEVFVLIWVSSLHSNMIPLWC